MSATSTEKRARKISMFERFKPKDPDEGVPLNEIEPEPWGDWMNGRAVALSPLARDDYKLHVLKTDAEEEAFNQYFDQHDEADRVEAAERLRANLSASVDRTADTRSQDS